MPYVIGLDAADGGIAAGTPQRIGVRPHHAFRARCGSGGVLNGIVGQRVRIHWCETGRLRLQLPDFERSSGH